MFYLRQRIYHRKLLKNCKAGYKKIKDTSYDIIGNLDADISFRKDYFEFLLNKFNENFKLGAAGTPFVEESFKGYDFRFVNIEHVSGACQLFRRECFEEIGGYIPVRECIDGEIQLRKKGLLSRRPSFMGNTAGFLSNEATALHNRNPFLFHGIWGDNVKADRKTCIERSYTILPEGTDVPATKYFVPTYAMIAPLKYKA